MRDRQRKDERPARKVAEDHDVATAQAVGVAGEQRAADDPGQIGDREARGGQQRRVRVGEDEDSDGDPGQLVTNDGQCLGDIERAELAVRQNVTERDAATGYRLTHRLPRPSPWVPTVPSVTRSYPHW